MVVTKNGKKYYTIDESKKITDKFIEKSADELIVELRKRRAKNEKVKTKEKTYA